MNSKAKTIALIAGLVVLIAASAFAYNKLGVAYQPESQLASMPETPQVSDEEDDLPEEPDETGEPAQSSEIDYPDFTVYTADGTAVSLSDTKGKPTVVNFWASWCPPCKEEMPDFEKVYLEFGGEVNFMMIDAVDGSRETQETGEKYIADNGYTFPVYYDLKLDAVTTYGITAFPTTVFLDSDGVPITYARGMINEETLRHGIAIIKGEAGLATE